MAPVSLPWLPWWDPRPTPHSSPKRGSADSHAFPGQEKHLETEMQPRNIRHAPTSPCHTLSNSHLYTHVQGRNLPILPSISKISFEIKILKRDQKPASGSWSKGGRNPLLYRSSGQVGLGKLSHLQQRQPERSEIVAKGPTITGDARGALHAPTRLLTPHAGSEHADV